MLQKTSPYLRLEHKTNDYVQRKIKSCVSTGISSLQLSVGRHGLAMSHGITASEYHRTVGGRKQEQQLKSWSDIKYWTDIMPELESHRQQIPLDDD